MAGCEIAATATLFRGRAADVVFHFLPCPVGHSRPLYRSLTPPYLP